MFNAHVSCVVDIGKLNTTMELPIRCTAFGTLSIQRRAISYVAYRQIPSAGDGHTTEPGTSDELSSATGRLVDTFT